MTARRMLRILGIVWVLMVMALPALAQELIGLEGVEPREGYPGQELELTLWGHGFRDAREVSVLLGGIEVLEAWVEADDVIMLQIVIPDGAPPGPRPIEVAASFGPNEVFTAGLEDGFWVLEREAQPTSPDTGETRAAPVIDGVEPQRVQQGSEVELNVFGRDFSPEAWVEVGGEGVYVHDVEFINPEHLLAFIEVEDDAPAGWRAVWVINPGDQVGERPRALEVVGEGVPPAPVPSPTPAPRPDGGIPLGPLAGGAAVLLAVGGAIGRALSLRAPATWTEQAQLQWQLEAETELPEPKQACTWACKGEATTDLLKRWQVMALELTPFPLPSGRAPAAKRVEGQVLEQLNEAVHPQYILEGEEETRQRVAPVVDALLQQIVAWNREGRSPASIRVDARLRRDVKCQFKLYHCEQAGPALQWVDHGLKWKRTLHQPGGEYLGVLRGPKADEPDFEARAREELESLLLQLLKAARFRP